MAFVADLGYSDAFSGMELMVGFLEARNSVLNAIHQIVNRMADLNAAANDGLATDSDVQNYNAEFNALHQQLAILREE